MNEITGKRVLQGNEATLLIDGIPFAECLSCNATVTYNRKDIQLGYDVDSKVVGVVGAGTLQMHHVYTLGRKKALEYIKRGEDPRFVMISRLKDGDAVGKQVESVVLENVWINNFSLIDWARGDTVAEEINFGYTPTKAQITEAIL